jgi:hypothetical protein
MKNEIKFDYKIMGLGFEKTCGASPEEYDVYNEKGKVAYIRLRWGCLTVEPYEKPDDEFASDDTICIFSEEFDTWQGKFNTEEQRIEYLTRCARKIIEYLKEKEIEDMLNKNLKYKVGDKVMVRKDLEADKKYGKYYFSDEMNIFKGEVVTVQAIKDGGYWIKEAFLPYFFTDEMLEDVPKDYKHEESEEIKDPFAFKDVSRGDAMLYMFGAMMSSLLGKDDEK